MRLRWLPVVLFSLLPTFASAADPAPAEPDGLFAEFVTPKGVIVCELFHRDVPLTVINFVGLAEGTIPAKGRKPGEHFFDGLTFNRVVPGFVIQGGDPQNDPTGGNDGGPGYEFDDEFLPQLRHTEGALSMANEGPHTNGSQFFITHRDVHRLNYLHTVFGRVVRGLDVVNRIEERDKIEQVRIVRRGEAAKKFEASVIAFEIFKKRAALIANPADRGDAFTYFEDRTKSLADFRVKNFNFKLANYEKFRRIRIAVRVFEKEKPEDVDLKALMAATGVGEKTGALLCYFSAADEWKLIVGSEHFAALNHGPVVDPAAFIKDGLHARKQALLERARELSKEWKEKKATASATSAPPAIAGAPTEPYPQLKQAFDSALDTLIIRLDDHYLGRP